MHDVNVATNDKEMIPLMLTYLPFSNNIKIFFLIMTYFNFLMNDETTKEIVPVLRYYRRDQKIPDSLSCAHFHSKSVSADMYPYGFPHGNHVKQL